jgi:hypothetical protein
MKKRKNYIPSKEADFIVWLGNLIAVCKLHITDWNLLETVLTELETLYTRIKELHENAKSVSFTKGDMQEKNAKKKEARKMVAIFVRNNLQNNYAMTDEGRTALGIPIHDSTHSPQSEPKTIPVVETETPQPRVIRIKFRAENAERWGKSDDAHGLECKWVLSDTAPTHIDDLIYSEFATSSPMELVFDESDRGKKIYFAVRWENGTAKKGRWSDIMSAIIP